jgi:hypothetical protein
VYRRCGRPADYRALPALLGALLLLAGLPRGLPILHVLPVDEWLAAESAHVPAWLPAGFRQPLSG